MKRLGALVVCWLCLGVAACDRSDSIRKDKEEGSTDEVPEGKKPTAGIDCAAYCNKQRACFPGALEDVPRWSRQCVADCKRDEAKGGAIAVFTRATAACTDRRCGEPFGTCIGKQLEKLVAKKDREQHPYMGLPQQCLLSQACFLAQSYGHVDAEGRERVRQRLGLSRRTFFVNLAASNVEAATMSCRMEIESAHCAGPSPQKSEGPAIELSCDDYCAKQKTCYPKNSAAADWKANCWDACKAEAKAGSTEAAFFAAVAACKAAPCGDEHGQCVAKQVDKLWPKDARKGWDMRGLGVSCMLMRACAEATFHDSKVGPARLGRQATYDIYRKVFGQLKKEGTDTSKHCTTMASYVECK